MKKYHDTVALVLPERKKGKESMMIGSLGWLLRCVLAFFSAYGLLRFLCGSVGLPVGGGYILSAALILCTVFSVMSFSKTLFAILGVLMLSGGVLYFSLGGKPVESLIAVLKAFSGSWYSRLCELGYRYGHAVPDLSGIAEEAGRSEGELYLEAMCLAAVFICAVSVFFTVRRARLFPMLAVVTVISTVILYFGAGDDLFAFGLVIASLLATASLCYYDSVFANRSNVMAVLGTDIRSSGAMTELSGALRESLSRGGYVGAAVLLLALVIVMPLVGIDRAMTDIPSVSEPTLRVEKYISALVNGYSPGGDGLLSLLGDELDGHGTKARSHTPNGKVLLTVYSDTSAPIYLRTWTGIDYIDDKWYTVSYGRRDSYRELFGENFSSDALFYAMRTAIDPSLAGMPEVGEDAANRPLGYITSRVGIKKSSPSGEVILPTETRHGDGIMKFGTSEPHFIGYGSYHDGVYSGSTFALSDSYTVNADITVTPSRSLAYNISVFVKHYSEQYSAIKEIRGMLDAGATEDEITARYESLEGSNSVVSDAYEALENSYDLPNREDTLAYRYVYAMTPAEREETDALCARLAAYNEYVYGNYVTLCENHESLSGLMGKIADANGMRFRREAATYVGRHRSVMTVIEYLTGNMVYTLSPKAPDSEREYINAVDTFLFDTNEGYCVQYATAAVMLLRSVGVPARYVEGYIADDFRPSDSDEAAYVCKVTDLKRHAWIEVYYDYYGWVRYEATAPYAATDGWEEIIEDSGADVPSADMFYEDTSGIAESEGGEVKNPDASEGVPAEEDKGENGLLIAVISVAAVLSAITASVCIAILALKARFGRFYGEMRGLIRTVSDRNTSGAELLDAARKMGDIVTRLLGYHSLTPLSGETATAFAVRCDKQMRELVGISIENAMRAMQAGEFSDSITKEEALCLAEYLDRLYRASVNKAGRLEAIKLKCFWLVS